MISTLQEINMIAVSPRRRLKIDTYIVRHIVWIYSTIHFQISQIQPTYPALGGYVLGCVYHLSKVRNAFQYPLSKRVYKRLPKRVSRVVAFITELYREYESRGRPCLSLRSCIAQFDPRVPLCRSVRDINTFQNDFAFIISTETCFWLKRVSDRTFYGVSNPLIKTALRLSSAKITLKVVWKP